MRCFVINLERSTDRLAAFFAGWAAPFPCERFAAADADLFTMRSDWKHSPGGCGLNLTYVAMFAELLRSGVRDPVAVFEDDADLAPGWWETTAVAIEELPVGWWQINLGPHTGYELAHHAADQRFTPPAIVGNHLARMSHAWRTHAAIYNPAAMWDMIALLGRHPWPVDQIWCDQMLGGSTRFYCTRLLLAGTRAGRSTCDDRTWGAWSGQFGLGKPVHDSCR